MNFFDSILDGLSAVYTENIVLKEPFIVFAQKFANDFGTVILLSGNNHMDCGKYNILGCMPWFHLIGKNDNLSISIDNKKINFNFEPMDILKQLLKICDMQGVIPNSPISSGLMGYMAYEMKNVFKKKYIKIVKNKELPDIYFVIPSIIIVNDISSGKTKLFLSSSRYKGLKEQEKILSDFYVRLNLPVSKFGNFTAVYNTYKSNFTHSEYIKTINKVKKYINSGDIYQVNISQQFSFEFKGEPFSFFKTIYDINPAPFFAYINAGNHQIISTSPERLVFRDKYMAEVRPIKGTSPRGETLYEDRIMKDKLLNSLKNEAELSMIVDLLRNDLGKVCQEGSVYIKEHKRLEYYHNVYHLISIIQGKLNIFNDSINLIKAIFPGGSITGCPKIRAIEIIDELEKSRRHIYTGSIGYISFHNTMDLSVAIRTALIFNNKVYFSVGGGIVYDSNPEDEFEETLHKGKTVVDVFGIKYNDIFNNTNNGDCRLVWKNGLIQPLDNAKIEILDLALYYGFAFFETIYVNNMHIFFLIEHIERFNNAWINLFKINAPKLNWCKIIKQMLRINGFKNKMAVVKIIATRGNPMKSALFDGSILIVVKSYKHRLGNINDLGLKAGIYPNIRYTPLACYKTTNYLYYYFANLWANYNNFDEAIILNFDGTISEGNSSNIFLIYKKNAIIPESKFVLSGVTQHMVINQLKRMRYKIIMRSVSSIELYCADAVFMTNSLFGVLPVISINNKNIETKLELATIVNRKLGLTF